MTPQNNHNSYRYITQNNVLYTLYLSGCLILTCCQSGKIAYQKGQYYEAILQAVQRLREDPAHKKASEILKLSYPMAIEHLESDSKNQMNANAPFKYQKILDNHTKINNLYNQIKTSPAALRIIPNPTNKFEEITEIRKKATEEIYETGIQSLLKNTREDAKNAYFLFQKVNTLSPGYKESIDMIKQAKFNATLKVVVEHSPRHYDDWNFEPAIFKTNLNQFVKFYSPKEIKNQKIDKIDQKINIIVNGLRQQNPTISKQIEHFTDSVKIAVDKKKEPIYKTVNASLITYIKEITGTGTVTLIITDLQNNIELYNTRINQDETWRGSWGECRGDIEAIPNQIKRLCQIREQFMDRNYLYLQIEKSLDYKIQRSLQQFYRTY